MTFPKYERIYIKPLMNGFEVEYDHRDYKPDAKDKYDYNTIEEVYTYKTWDEVVEFVKEHPLTVPAIS